MLAYGLPLSEMMLDFYDKLKFATRGYAGFDCSMSSYQTGDLAQLDILVDSEIVDALSTIIDKVSAFTRGRTIRENSRISFRVTCSEFFSEPRLARASSCVKPSPHCAKMLLPNAAVAPSRTSANFLKNKKLGKRKV